MTSQTQTSVNNYKDQVNSDGLPKNDGKNQKAADSNPGSAVEEALMGA